MSFFTTNDDSNVVRNLVKKFSEKGRGSNGIPFERAMVVSYRLSIVTVALSVTIWPQFAIECLQRSNQQRVGHFGSKFPVASLGVDP